MTSAFRGLLAVGASAGLVALGVVAYRAGNAQQAPSTDAKPDPAPVAAITKPNADTPKVEPPRPIAPATEKVVAKLAPAKPVVGGKSDLIMFGGTPDRNMVNMIDTNIPGKPPVIEADGTAKDEPGVDGKLLWKAELGSRAYGGPVVARGKVIVGTNNGRPRNPRDTAKTPEGEIEPIDRGVVMTFDEKSGSFLWQAVHTKLAAGNVNDWPHEGVCSTPAIDGDKVYYISNRCTVVCADLHGMADGAQGKKRPGFDSPTDADILWEYDMMGVLDVFPHNMACCSPVVVGDLVFIVSANGVDEGHVNLPSPQAPSFLALNKNTGELKWKSNAPGKNIMHGQWSNPTYAEIKGVKTIIFPGGDGWLYGMKPDTGDIMWKFDANPKESKYELGGAGTRNDFISTPVVHDGKVYIGVGQDPEHFTNVGHMWCFDPAGKTGDISPVLGPMGKVGTPNPNSAVVWHYGGPDKRPNVPQEFRFGRTMSTACIVDDVLYIAELRGFLHCLDLKTGKLFWQYDLKGAVWGSPYFVDGKVYIATESCDLFVFKHSKTPKSIDEMDNPKAKNDKEFRAAQLAKRKEVEAAYLVSKVEFDAPIRSTPVVANGTLYVMTEKTLYAFGKK